MPFLCVANAFRVTNSSDFAIESGLVALRRVDLMQEEFWAWPSELKMSFLAAIAAKSRRAMSCLYYIILR